MEPEGPITGGIIFVDGSMAQYRGYLGGGLRYGPQGSLDKFRRGMEVHLGFISSRCGWFSWRWECFHDDGEECLGDDGEAGHDGAVDDELEGGHVHVDGHALAHVVGAGPQGAAGGDGHQDLGEGAVDHFANGETFQGTIPGKIDLPRRPDGGGKEDWILVVLGQIHLGVGIGHGDGGQMDVDDVIFSLGSGSSNNNFCDIGS